MRLLFAQRAAMPGFQGVGVGKSGCAMPPAWKDSARVQRACLAGQNNKHCFCNFPGKILSSLNSTRDWVEIRVF
jgi:hypothetical protein